MRKTIIQIVIIAGIFLTMTKSGAENNTYPERTLLFTIDAMTSGLHEKISLPGFENLMKEGVFYSEVYLPPPAHPDSGKKYPWTCSLPNPVLMAGTVFIGQENIKQHMIQHSFQARPTAFAVNAWPYEAISHGFTIYEDYSNGIFERVFQDELSVEGAKKIIKKHNPEFIRIHCQGPGSAGHKSHRDKNKPYTGNIWHPGSPFIRQHQYVDSLLTEFVGWLKAEDLWSTTVLMVMGDHGQGKSGGHPPFETGSYKTQLIIAGAAIRKNVSFPYAEITDIAPTIAWLHKVQPPRYSNGRVLTEIIEESKQPRNIPKPMKELTETLVDFKKYNEELYEKSFYSIDNIGIWHTGDAGNNYHEFVQNLRKNLISLKQTTE